MPDSSHTHVVQHPDGGWATRREAAERVSEPFDTQAEAIQAAREVALRERGEVFVHDRGGRIRDRDSYGGDPFPPRDRKH